MAKKLEHWEDTEANASQSGPVFANQTSDSSTPGYNTSLIVDLANSTATADVPAGNYGLSVPDLGDVYGATASVVGKKDYQEFGFQIDEGMCKRPRNQGSSPISQWAYKSTSAVAYMLMSLDTDAIYHVLTSASQSWFACLDSVSGNAQQSYFLKWGVFTSGGNVPDGCSVTNVIQVLNLDVDGKVTESS